MAMAMAMAGLPCYSQITAVGQHRYSYSATNPRGGMAQRTRRVHTRAHKVEIRHGGKTHTLEVEDGETILEKALEAGLDLPHDCKLGVCMTCPAKLETGQVNQSMGMLSDDVIEKGYALLCSSYPLSDCSIRTIPEDELLSLQLVTSSD